MKNGHFSFTFISDVTRFFDSLTYVSYFRRALLSKACQFAFNMDLVKGKEVLFVQTGFYFIDKSVNNA